MNRTAQALIESRSALSKCGNFRLVLAEDYAELIAAVENLRAGLEEIAAGEGVYGAQAYEYKQIARAALIGAKKRRT